MLSKLFNKLTLPALICLSLFPSYIGAKESAESRKQTVELHWDRPARANLSTSNTAAKQRNIQLYPKACSLCHPAKYKDWSNSLHSRSVGPGLNFQLSPFENPGFATTCYECHAPLLEQSEVVLERDGFDVNRAFDKELKSTGVSCASCHQRGSVIYGPDEPSQQGPAKVAGSGHNSKKNSLFSSAEFCAACHQLDSGYKLNGRVLTNTYNEWKESRYAKEGITCQQCHMPDRRHLWRGIHDPDMVLSGLGITTEFNRNSSNKEISAHLIIINSGVGHMFPTYVTPSVTVSGYLRDEAGEEIKGSRRSEIIARRVPLDLSVERFDTRIPPEGSFQFTYLPPNEVLTPEATDLLLEIKVEPDEFYNRFFASMLSGADDMAESEPNRYRALKDAYQATVDSRYMLYRKVFSLTD